MAHVVVVAEVVRLGPTVAATTVPSRFSIGVRDKREGLQEGA
jgi:hypothetical protein